MKSDRRQGTGARTDCFLAPRVQERQTAPLPLREGSRYLIRRLSPMPQFVIVLLARCPGLDTKGTPPLRVFLRGEFWSILMARAGLYQRSVSVCPGPRRLSISFKYFSRRAASASRCSSGGKGVR